MKFEKVVFGFFIILALALNVVFVVSAAESPGNHGVWILTSAIIINLVATALKLGDRSHIGALLLASSLVSDLLLIGARILWIVMSDPVAGSDSLVAIEAATIMALATGALVANVISCLILVGDTLMMRR